MKTAFSHSQAHSLTIMFVRMRVSDWFALGCMSISRKKENGQACHHDSVVHYFIVGLPSDRPPDKTPGKWMGDKVAPCVKHLPHSAEDLSLDPRILVKVEGEN